MKFSKTIQWSLVVVIIFCVQHVSAQLIIRADPGTNVYYSSTHPSYVADSVNYFGGVSYWGKGKVIKEMSSKEMKIFRDKGGFFVLEKDGYMVSVTPNTADLWIKSKSSYSIALSQDMDKLPLKSANSLNIIAGSVEVEIDEDIEIDKDRFSYFNRVHQDIDESQNTLGATFELISGYFLRACDHVSSRELGLQDYQSLGMMDGKIHLANLNYNGWNGGYVMDIKITITITDAYGAAIYSESIDKNGINTSELLSEYNKLMYSVLNADEIKKSRNKLMSNYQDTITNWSVVSMSSFPAKDDACCNSNAVVTISTNNGHGSGCVIGKDGFVITNHHVVWDADTIEIILENRDTLQAKVIRMNPVYDLALLKVDYEFKDGFHIAKDKVGLQLRDPVYSIGTPVDRTLYSTVSKGVVTGKRTFNERDTYQVSANVNPGNSGGALVNELGMLVGVVNAKLIGFGTKRMGFAIPSYQIMDALKIELK